MDKACRQWLQYCCHQLLRAWSICCDNTSLANAYSSPSDCDKGISILSLSNCDKAVSIFMIFSCMSPCSQNCHAQVGFMMRLDGGTLTADLEDFLPDYQLAFVGVSQEAEGFYYTFDKGTELNERFGDLLYKIKDLEVGSIMSRFGSTVLLYMEGLSRHARNKLLYSSNATSQVKPVVCTLKLWECRGNFKKTELSGMVGPHQVYCNCRTKWF